MPGSSSMSTNKSMRLPGPSPKRVSRVIAGSAGWPSIAITQAAWPSTLNASPRAAVALMSRRRSRSPLITGTSGRDNPLTRTGGTPPPTGPAVPSTNTMSRSTRTGSASSTISAPWRPCSSWRPPAAWYQNVPASGGRKRYSKRAPGATGGWVSAGTPSMALSSRIPCQCTALELGKLVDETHAQLVAAFDAQDRPRHRAVKAEDRGRRLRLVAGAETPGAQLAETVGCGLRVGVQGQAAACGCRRRAGEDPPTRHRLGARRHRCRAGSDQFTLMPAAFTSWVLVSISLRTSASNCSELSGIGSAPRLASLSRTAGFCSAFAISA